jgi:hypothetical protein
MTDDAGGNQRPSIETDLAICGYPLSLFPGGDQLVDKMNEMVELIGWWSTAKEYLPFATHGAEPRIIVLVRALNNINDILTRFSCQGHDDPGSADDYRPPYWYVTFFIRDDDGTGRTFNALNAIIEEHKGKYPKSDLKLLNDEDMARKDELLKVYQGARYKLQGSDKHDIGRLARRICRGLI